MTSTKGKIGRLVTIVGLILILLVGSVWYLSWFHLSRKVPTTYASVEQQFNYGTIGSEQLDSVPYWIWLVLPRLFPKKLPGPGGYVSLKMDWEPGEEVPVGLSKQTIGFPRVSLNCAACHNAQFSSASNGESKIILTGSAPTFDLQGYINFLRSSANDPRFTANYLLNKLEDVYELSWLEKNFYRYIIIPQSQQALSQLNDIPELLKSHPEWAKEAMQQFPSIEFQNSQTAQLPNPT
ncbi:hypothetical protein H6G76_28090 [Nostoc sp. FACHB-152]|uniref:hypothetical protein n=1 Tax=unclassified Nostoc TaxID=2593658 RepID=UPI001682E7F1|nr:MULTISPECIES: hypothetical protein [unclassified Nostoc]MBD2450920.1 hypothetical protein [Nostoc sp. FACHB-152]MBD2471280.1 hypothetical protein [Nostoc sp. FACHB-145]